MKPKSDAHVKNLIYLDLGIQTPVKSKNESIPRGQNGDLKAKVW